MSKKSSLTKEDKFVLALIYGAVFFIYFSYLVIPVVFQKLLEIL